MDFTARPMKGMVFVEPAGLHGDALRRWVDAAACYARSLPPKQATPARNAADLADSAAAVWC
jgi:hypothetical protein